MAQHNRGSRAFLLIVLGGIVIGFVIAAFLLGGDDSETSVKVDKMEQPAMEESAGEVPVAPAEDMSNENTPPPEDMCADTMMDDVSPPDEMPADDAGMSDGLSPPDEMPADTMPEDSMPDEAMPDEAPDAMTPDENPEEAMPESPPPAPNP